MTYIHAYVSHASYGDSIYLLLSLAGAVAERHPSAGHVDEHRANSHSCSFYSTLHTLCRVHVPYVDTRLLSGEAAA